MLAYLGLSMGLPLACEGYSYYFSQSVKADQVWLALGISHRLYQLQLQLVKVAPVQLAHGSP